MPSHYQDKLVELTAEKITFHHYYFPFCDRSVPFKQIEDIQVTPASILTGRWRLWGTGDFRTWFPLDMKRPKRDRIFIVSLRGSKLRIGFTVEDSAKVEAILKASGLLHSVPAA